MVEVDEELIKADIQSMVDILTDMEKNMQQLAIKLTSIIGETTRRTQNG